MRFALWTRSIRDAFWLLLACTVCMTGFQMLWVWITSLIKVSHFQRMLTEFAPRFVADQISVPLDFMITSVGRVGAGYEHPMVLALICIWAIARGSDTVSGPLGRGTMEMLLAQPVRRLDVLSIHAATTLFGSVILAVGAWCGTRWGVALVTLEQPVAASVFWPAVVNVACLGVFMGGLATLLSSCDQHRGHTIGLAVGFVVVQWVLKIVANTTPDLDVYHKMTILSVFQPQWLVYGFFEQTDTAWSVFWQYNGLLLGLGVVGFVLAAAVFCRRDLPAPL